MGAAASYDHCSSVNVAHVTSSSLAFSSSKSFPSASVSSNHMMLKDLILETLRYGELRLYVLLTWIPGNSDDPYFQAEGRAIALNFIDFINEARDFASIPSCRHCGGFQYYRACFLFEKFLMHGAACHVPLSSGSRVVDECSAALYGGREELACCLSAIFSAGVTEALDFLVAEVLPSFERNVSLSGLFYRHMRDISRTIQAANFYDCYFEETDMKQKQREALDFILSEATCYEALQHFSDQLYESGGDLQLQILLCALGDLRAAAMEVTSLVTAPPSCCSHDNTTSYSEERSSAELSMVTFLHVLHRFYNTYLSASYPTVSKLKLADATKGDFLLKVAKVTTPSSDVLLPVEMDILHQLSSRYLQPFLGSAEYQELLSKGYRSPKVADYLSSARVRDCSIITDLCSDLRNIGAAPSHRLTGEGKSQYHDQSHVGVKEGSAEEEKQLVTLHSLQRKSSALQEVPAACEEKMFTEKTSVVGGQAGERADTRGRTDMSACNDKLAGEITNFLSSQHDFTFAKYLEAAHQEMSLVHFCQSATRYKVMQCCCPCLRSLVLCDLSPRHMYFVCDADVIGESCSIFERYLSCNATEQVKLPESVVLRITRGMFSPDLLLFEEALEYVLVHRLVSQQRWQAFKRDVLLIETSSGSGGGICNGSTVAVTHSEQRGMEGLEVSGQLLPNLKTCSERLLASHGDTWTEKILMGSRDVAEKTEASDNSCARPRRKSNGSVNSGGGIARVRKASMILRKDGRKYTEDGIRFEDVMSRSQCLSIFKRFLDAEGVMRVETCVLPATVTPLLDHAGCTSQTILFLIEVDEFQKIPVIGFQQNRARKIFYKFIHDKCIMPVPIASETRHKISDEFLSNEVSALIFAKATQEVKTFVEVNQFSRFMLSTSAGKVTHIITEEVTADTEHSGDDDEETYVPCLRRKPTYKQYLEAELRTLADMFDLRLLLKHPTGVRFFKDFCVRTHCNENLFFWLDADNYSQLPGKYIDDKQANNLQVNISSKSRTTVLAGLPQSGRLMFECAQEEVFQLMKAGTFPAFLKSVEFEQLKNYFDLASSSRI